MYWGRRVCSYVRSTEEQVWMYGAFIVLGASAESSGELLLQWYRLCETCVVMLLVNALNTKKCYSRHFILERLSLKRLERRRVINWKVNIAANTVTFVKQSCCVTMRWNVTKCSSAVVTSQLLRYATRQYLKCFTCHETVLQWPFHCRVTAKHSK